MASLGPNYNLLFITETILKDLSIINNNTDMKILTPTIKLAQDMYLTRILGDSLMTDLQNKASEGSLNGSETFLLNAYIQPALIWAILKEAPPVFVYRYMNKGVEKKNSDNSTPADLNEVRYLVDKASNNFDWYAQRLMDYLCVNQTLFPAYSNETTADQRGPSNRGYRTSLYLGNSSTEGNCSIYRKYR